jgi:diguanylate cyclase (GGDEF)-like protein/PAS domain S-box-containing protein
MNVLVYSPDKEMRERIGSLPCLDGLDVEEHGDYVAAREAFESTRHRLVVVQATGIESNGLSLSQKIRALSNRVQTVVVLVAPEEDPVLHRLAIHSGADDVIDGGSSDEMLENRLSKSVARSLELERSDDRGGDRLAMARAMDRMQLGVTITDLEGTILYTNDADAQMHGYLPDELIGQNVRMLSPPDSWKQMTPDQARNMKSWRRETTNIRKDGSEFTVQLLSDVVVDADANPVAIVTVAEDVSNRTKIEDNLGGTREELSCRVRERTTELLEANIRLQHEILERRKAERRLLYEALHDSVTDLPNRALFYDRLSRVLAGSDRHPDHLFAVLYLDLDQYRVVTESLGPEACDRLLIQAADRLRNSVRPEDTIGCAGGDEFFILVEDLKTADDASRVARRIQKALAAPMDISGQTVFTTASIGIAFSTTGYEKSEDMIRDAQIAMFRAQAGTGGDHVIFDRQMHDRAVTRMKLEMELRQALDHHEITVHYQPIVDLDTGRIEGLEALARWETAQGGSVPPNEFIPLAEETGIIFDLEQQILKRVCADIKTWRSGMDGVFPFVSVNLSGKELTNPRFARQVGEILEGFDVDPLRLRFELTESSIVQNAAVAADVLAELNALGVLVYIDDFGTGYSSLSSLHSFPIDTLKIDQSFVSGTENRPGNWEIVKVIIGLAKNLGLDVIAEGIETVEQLSAIRELGCHYGQGYYFSRPVRPAEVAGLFDSPTIEVVA